MRMLIPRITLRTKALSACLALVVGCPAAVVYVKYERQQGFELVKIGDTRASVERVMGSPSVIEGQGEAFRRYSNGPCDCFERLWYENRLALDIEAWSVDIGQDGRVTKKYHWVSP